MPRIPFFTQAVAYLSLLLMAGCAASSPTPEATSGPITKIAFGSCGHEDHPLPIFNNIVAHNPDMFIFLGDNIYGDTDIMDTLKAKYGRLAAKPGFQKMKAQTEILATWDDHDFGRNDAGRHYPFKEASKEIFLNFWGEPEESERRERPGIYASYLKQYGDKTLQIIMLDNRTFRDKIKPYNGEKEGERRYFYGLDYIPYETADSTLLGEAQWAWLEQELQKPADIRLIGSSTQFSIEYNGYEAWANFPHERQRFLDLIKKTKANGVLF
ncbi:MAG: alkaline phosphatase D family protein, partial [Bacteroidota bacterium]